MKAVSVSVVIAAMAFTGQTLAASPDPAQSTLGPKAACRLASQTRIRSNTRYTFHGHYSLATHGSWFELPGCDAGFTARVDGAALSRISSFHSAFREKCGSNLMGDDISGLFTGQFIRARVRVPLANISSMENVFVITDIVTTDEDPAYIDCPK